MHIYVYIILKTLLRLVFNTQMYDLTNEDQKSDKFTFWNSPETCLIVFLMNLSDCYTQIMRIFFTILR